MQNMRYFKRKYLYSLPGIRELSVCEALLYNASGKAINFGLLKI